MYNYVYEFGCTFCKKAGKPWRDHELMTPCGEICCNELLQAECSYCHKKAHTIKHCPSLLKKNEKSAKKYDESFPELTNTPCPKKKQVTFADTVKTKPKTKPVVYLEKHQRKATAEEAFKRIQQKHITSMETKYGSYWFNHVESTDEDCDAARVLRLEYAATEDYAKSIDLDDLATQDYCDENELFDAIDDANQCYADEIELFQAIDNANQDANQDHADEIELFQAIDNANQDANQDHADEIGLFQAIDNEHQIENQAEAYANLCMFYKKFMHHMDYADWLEQEQIDWDKANNIKPMSFHNEFARASRINSRNYKLMHEFGNSDYNYNYVLYN